MTHIPSCTRLTRSEMQEEAGTHLRLDQDQINEEYYKVVFDILVGESLTSRALSQAYTFSKRLVVRLAVGGVQRLSWEAASGRC